MRTVILKTNSSTGIIFFKWRNIIYLFCGASKWVIYIVNTFQHLMYIVCQLITYLVCHCLLVIWFECWMTTVPNKCLFKLQCMECWMMSHSWAYLELLWQMYDCYCCLLCISMHCIHVRCNLLQFSVLLGSSLALFVSNNVQKLNVIYN